MEKVWIWNQPKIQKRFHKWHHLFITRFELIFMFQVFECRMHPHSLAATKKRQTLVDWNQSCKFKMVCFSVKRYREGSAVNHVNPPSTQTPTSFKITTNFEFYLTLTYHSQSHSLRYADELDASKFKNVLYYLFPLNRLHILQYSEVINI